MSNKVLQYNVAYKGRIKREEKAKIVASVWEDKDNLKEKNEFILFLKSS